MGETTTEQSPLTHSDSCSVGVVFQLVQTAVAGGRYGLAKLHVPSGCMTSITWKPSLAALV